jgi:hypothetical protein
MSKLLGTATLVCICLVVPPPVNSNDFLAMRVSTLAPGALIVHFIVQRDADNRALAVTAEAPDFYRSSQIPLEGDRAPRATVIHLRGLPATIFEVTGTLVGSRGERATTIQFARVRSELSTRTTRP